MYSEKWESEKLDTNGSMGKSMSNKLSSPSLSSFRAFVWTSLKVNKFQNEFMNSSFLPKYKPKIVRISALYSEGRNFDNFVHILGETMTS